METDAESELLQADHGVSAEIMLSDEEGYGASQTTAGATVIRTCLKQSKPSKRISNPATFRVRVSGLTAGDNLHACPMNSIRGSPTSSQHAYFCIGPFGRLRRGELPQKMSPIIATQSTEEIDIALVFDGDKQEKLVITITVKRGNSYFSVDCKQSVSVRQLRAQSPSSADDTP